MRCTPNHLRCGSVSCWVHTCSLRGTRKYMRTKDKSQRLMAVNEATFDEQLKTAKGQAQYQPLVRLIAQVLDAGADGADCNLRIGVTRGKNAFLLTLYQEGDASYASGLDWDTFLEQVALLL